MSREGGDSPDMGGLRVGFYLLYFFLVFKEYIRIECINIRSGYTSVLNNLMVNQSLSRCLCVRLKLEGCD